MSTWILIAGGGLLIVAFVAIVFGQLREKTKADQLKTDLRQRAPRAIVENVDFNSLKTLPAPVERYLRHVLTDGQRLIERVTIQQSGILRTSITSKSWCVFNATHLAIPTDTCFFWNAKVEMPLATHIRILDSYIAGGGSGRISLLSAIPMAAESGTPELNSGALQRYLAEAVWYPTALLPGSGVSWTEINDHTALATLTDKRTTVSLEFRFNKAGEVSGIYTPRRFARFGGGYRQLPWEGHFRNYEIHSGMRIPVYGEVGWYISDEWQAVWKGDLADIQYDLVASVS